MLARRYHSLSLAMSEIPSHSRMSRDHAGEGARADTDVARDTSGLEIPLAVPLAVPPAVDGATPDLEHRLVYTNVFKALFGHGTTLQIGKYVVERHIGEGGMGEVYLCRDPDLDRRVAIKRMLGTTGVLPMVSSMLS